MVKSVCSYCGSPYEQDSTAAQCPTCKPKDNGDRDKYVRGNRHERGYGYRWERLSLKARQLQPFCSDCGRTDRLTADHSVTAWKRFEQGKPIRLKDIDVVCVYCNTDRGAARGDDATDEYRRGGQVEITESWVNENTQ